MVKPGIPYLDIIKETKIILKYLFLIKSLVNTTVKNAIKNGLNEGATISLTSLKTGSAMITYFALEVCKNIKI